MTVPLAAAEICGRLVSSIGVTSPSSLTIDHPSGSLASPVSITHHSATLGGNPPHQELPCPAAGRIRFARSQVRNVTS